MTYFYVIDTADITVTWDLKKECGQRFGTRKAAETVAKEAATREPGKRFEIVETIADVVCPVGDAKITARR